MQINRPSKLKVLSIALIFSGALVLAEAKQAYADPGGPGAAVAGIVFLVVAGLATYATVMTTICMPVAAIKASNHTGGFGGAFGDCFLLREQSAQTEGGVPQQPGQVEQNETPALED